MLSRRYGLRSSKRLRILGKRLGFWAPIHRPETTTYAQCSNAPIIAMDIWMFVLSYYGSLLVILLELLVLTIAGVLQHIFLVLRLCRRSILAPPATDYFGDSMTNENCNSREGRRRLRYLHSHNSFVTQWNVHDDLPQSENGRSAVLWFRASSP